jgi:hypothetical protein
LYGVREVLIQLRCFLCSFSFYALGLIVSDVSIWNRMTLGRIAVAFIYKYLYKRYGLPEPFGARVDRALLNQMWCQSIASDAGFVYAKR